MGLDQNIIRRRADGSEISEIYWRKANFVHDYFTAGFYERGFDSDNCTEFPVDKKDLKLLAELCDEVLEKPSEAPVLLPTVSGFFFGSTEYDEWYFEDVKFTRDEITKLLKDRPLQKGESMYYWAWY